MDLAPSFQDSLTIQGETYQGTDDFDLRLCGYITPPFRSDHDIQINMASMEVPFAGVAVVAPGQHIFNDGIVFMNRGPKPGLKRPRR